MTSYQEFGRCVLLKRCCDALENKVAADCKFLVGEQKEEISACKSVLAIASPVFEKQFYGPLADQRPVELPDVKPDVFRKLLQFVYAHQVDIVSKEESLDLIEIAHKYWIADLINICVMYYLDNLKEDDMVGLCQIANISLLYDVDMKDLVIRRVQQSASHLLDSEMIKNLSKDLMLCIVQQNVVNVRSEMELIKAAVLWATVCSEEEDTSLSGKSVRSILNETGVFKHLRFLTLSDDHLDAMDILTDHEIDVIKCAIYSGCELSLPVYVCTVSKHRNCIPFLCDEKFKKIEFTLSVKELSSPTTVSETFEVKNTTESFILTDITLPSQKYSINSGSYFYEEKVQVKIIKFQNNLMVKGNQRLYVFEENPMNIMATGLFKGTVKYNDIIRVFINLKQSEPGFHEVKHGDRFKIYITFHKAGKYPIHTVHNSFRHEESNAIFSTSNNYVHMNKIRYAAAKQIPRNLRWGLCDSNK